MAVVLRSDSSLLNAMLVAKIDEVELAAQLSLDWQGRVGPSMVVVGQLSDQPD